MAIRRYKTVDYVSIISLDDKNEYIDFINDKKKHVYEPGTKLFSHHIVPLHDGGKDDPKNLVDLSFEDHLQAHYLIAKVYKTKIDKLTYQLMSGMEKEIYYSVRSVGAAMTHKLLKEKKENFWNVQFQIEMSKRAVEKDRAQGFEARSRGGKIGGKKRWKDYVIKLEDKYLFFYNTKKTVCIFNCLDGGDVLKELQKIHSNRNFKRVSPILKGQRSSAYGWSCERIILKDELVEES